MESTRRLAAIMFTDIVGYTALMGEDEDKAFELLEKNRLVQKPIIEKFNGRWLKEIGDGVLASFTTVSDAVYCAKAIQEACHSEDDLKLRIGIHQGEVVFKGEDVFGDGVNIASRLEPLAPIGGILVSESVNRDLGNKKGIETKFVREETLKNVKDPIRVYEVKVEAEETPASTHAQPIKDESKSGTKKAILISAGAVILILLALVFYQYQSNESSTPAQTIAQAELDKSIAVLPFFNDSPDPDNEYFCNGMFDEIITHLQKIADLNVKSRTSVEQYRNPNRDIRVIAEELEVAFLVEGSVRKSGDDLRITAQLIDARTGDHLWAEPYDGKYTDKIFDFQSNIAKQVASSLKAVITPDEEKRIDKLPTTDIRAYDFMIRGWEEIHKYWNTRNTNPLKLAHRLIDKALEIDPRYLDAIAAKSSAFLASQNYDSTYIYAKRAIEIDPESSKGYFAAGEYYFHSGEPDAAIQNYQLALKLYKHGEMFSPRANNAILEFILGFLYCYYKNDYQKGMPYIQKGIDHSDDINFVLWGRLGTIFFNIGDYDRADKYSRKLLESEYGVCWGIAGYSHKFMVQGKFNRAINFLDSICSLSLCDEHCNLFLYRNHLFLGQYDQAEKYYNQINYVEYNLMFSRDSLLLAYMYKELGKEQEAEVILDSYRISQESQLLQRKNFWTNMHLSMIHAILDEKEKSLKYLSDATDLGLQNGFHDFLPVFPVYKNLWDDPEFKAIVKRAQDEKAAQRAQVREMEERGELDL